MMGIGNEGWSGSREEGRRQGSTASPTPFGVAPLGVSPSSLSPSRSSRLGPQRRPETTPHRSQYAGPLRPRTPRPRTPVQGGFHSWNRRRKSVPMGTVCPLVRVYVCTCVYGGVCTGVCVRTCVYGCVCVCACVYGRVCAFACVSKSRVDDTGVTYWSSFHGEKRLGAKGTTLYPDTTVGGHKTSGTLYRLSFTKDSV